MNSVNSVNVYSIDEEKLKFRVICAFDAATTAYNGNGAYELDIPIPTAIANSGHYNQCRIKCENFVCLINNIAQSVNQVWSNGAAAIRSGCVELQASVGSGQTSSTSANSAALGAQDQNITIGGFRQLIPLQFVPNGGAAAAWLPAISTNGGWISVGESSSVLCASPFGQRLTLRLVDVFSRRNLFVADTAALAVDLGRYAFQFEVEMVENK